jgi:acetyl-CoA C-acetyltransferase
LTPVYILSAVRTPIGKFGGSLASLSAADMGVVAAKGALERAGVQPQQIEETIVGNARQAGGGPNPARQISIRSGVPQEVPAYTVNKACASGIKSIALAYQEVATGNLDCVLAGGTESMSRLPYYLEGVRWGYRLGHQELVDGMYRDGFFCPMAKMLMGETAEVLAGQYHISREEQDQFAIVSQQRAAAAQSAGCFDAEIVHATNICSPTPRSRRCPSSLRCFRKPAPSQQEIRRESPTERRRLSWPARNLSSKTI